MKRREFLLVSAGAGAAVATGGQAAAQEQSPRATVRGVQSRDGSMLQQEDDNGADENGNGEEENGDPDEAPGAVTVELGNYYYEPGTDAPLEIEPGTTVTFVWVSDNHDIAIDEQPAESDWEGETIHNTGHEHEHTFEVEGTYEFHCSPHIGLDMVGTIIVEEGITDEPDEPLPPAEQPIDPDTIGVPLQKHFIGIATFFAITLTIVFAFYVLKYGETPHSGYPKQ